MQHPTNGLSKGGLAELRLLGPHETSPQGPPKAVERKVAVVVPHVLMLPLADFVLLVLRSPVLHVLTVGGEQI